MNKMMYKQKRKAINNKENRDEENKMSRSNIAELIKTCSTGTKHKDIKTPQPKKSSYKEDHLNCSSIDFIKSIGWMDENESSHRYQHHSRDYGYDYDGGGYNAHYYPNNSSWNTQKDYNTNKKHNFYNNDYRR